MDTTVITPTAKGHRIWVQALASKGITGARVDVTITDSVILLTFGPDGKRKVTQSKGGIVDLVSNKITRWAQGATEATVEVMPLTQAIVIRRAN